MLTLAQSITTMVQKSGHYVDACTHLVPTLCVHVDRRQKAGLSWVCVDPAQRVQGTLVLHVKNFLLTQGLNCIRGALLLGNDECGDHKQPLLLLQHASQDSTGLDA